MAKAAMSAMTKSLLTLLSVLFVHYNPATVLCAELHDRMLQMQAASTPDACRLPPEWTGRWFLNEQNQPLTITQTSISFKGECVASNDAGFHLFRLETKNDVCWRCMVFFYEHRNILQFKETDAPPEPCPIDAPANFTYRDMKGPCRSRTSTIDACASSAKLRLHFQACPEIAHSESQVDDIECIGSWESHNNRYFAAKLVNNPALFEGEKYRCFMYEKQSDGGRVGISPDAACRGLIEVDSASTVIDYKIDSYPTAQCTFPSFLRHHHHDDGKKTWESVASNDIHRITADEWVEMDTSTGQNRSTAVCIQEEDLGKTHRIVVYLVSGCSRGYQCIRVHRRDEQVIELVRGLLAPNALEACSEEYIDEHLMTFDTLLLTGSVEQHCPNHGRYKIHGCDQDNSASYYFGCNAKHQLIVNKECRPHEAETYNCYGHWTERDVHFLVVKEHRTGKKHCYVYSKVGEVLSISGFERHPCHRSVLKGVTPRIRHNVSESDERCDPSSAALSTASSRQLSFLLVGLTVLSVMALQSVL